MSLTTLIIDGFINGQLRQVSVVYTDFINTLAQQVKLIALLPFRQTDPYQEAMTQLPRLKREYIFEPPADQLLDELLPMVIENSLFHAFLEARASEHSARMVTMKNASENAGYLMDELQLEFNKSRQASITSELLDITTASLTIT